MQPIVRELTFLACSFPFSTRPQAVVPASGLVHGTSFTLDSAWTEYDLSDSAKRRLEALSKFLHIIIYTVYIKAYQSMPDDKSPVSQSKTFRKES